jgi:hypothetical protein
MLRRPLTRRHALQAGSAALAATFLRPMPALASPAGLFELALGDELATAATAGGWRMLPVRRAPRRFDLLGLRWARGGDLEAEVRVRRRHGSWSEWLALHPTGAHAPDAEAAPGTDPAYTGTADFFQLRTRGSARRVRVRFVRAQPTARAARRLARRSALGRAALARQSQTSPAIVLRDEWGAAVVPPRAPASYGDVQLAFVHHTVTRNHYTPEESAGIVLGIARYHRDSNRWNDVGYNFLVDKYGQVFEGRAGGVDQPVIGAQAQGYNSVSTGIACLGDFTAIAASPAAMEALARLLAWKLGVHGTPAEGDVTVISAGGPTSRYRVGDPVVFERISGHRDGNNTSCPGTSLYGQLPALRARVAALSRPTPALTFAVSASQVRHPAVLHVSGTLSFGDGRSPDGAGVRIELQPTGAGVWETLGAATAGADGRWSAELSVPRGGVMRAVAGGDGATAVIVSRSAAVTVLPRLSARLSRTRIRRRGVVKLSGAIEPAPAGGRVEVYVERRSGRRWVLVRRRRLRVGRGGYATRLRLPVRGLYRVSVGAPGAVQRRVVRATA